MIYGGLYQHTRVVLYIYFTKKATKLIIVVAFYLTIEYSSISMCLRLCECVSVCMITQNRGSVALSYKGCSQRP